MVPTFEQPQHADLTPIMLIHRRAKHQVPFYRIDESGEMVEMFSLPSDGMEGMFPDLVPSLDKDCFFAINGFFQPAWMRRMTRQKKHLQRINAAFVDIDCHEIGITQGQAIGAIIDRMDTGAIPPVSLLVKSGRGVWCLWLLADRCDESQGQKATDYAIPMAELIQRDLWRRLQGLGADSNARDLCRITRVPGSINGKSGKRTEYWIRKNESGLIATYQLNDLANLLGVIVPWGNTVLAKNLEKKKAGHAGYTARWLNELRRFRTLWASRGAFPEGTRGGAVFLYLKFLRRCKHLVNLTDDEIRQQMESLYSSLEQPGGKRPKRRSKGVTSCNYTRHEFDEAIRRPNTGANPSHAMISQLLRITRGESTLTGWPEWGGVAEVEISSTKRRNERRRMLKTMMFDLDGRQKAVPSLRELQERLHYVSPDLDCAHKTIERDLTAIGVLNPRRRKKERGRDLFAGSD